jgi:hypothetical protein
LYKGQEDRDVCIYTPVSDQGSNETFTDMQRIYLLTVSITSAPAVLDIHWLLTDIVHLDIFAFPA